jgi:hypothetical protein
MEEELWFDSRQEENIFLFSMTSILALEPTQSPTQGVPELSPRGV